MEWWFLAVYMTWATQTIEFTPYGPFDSKARCERMQGRVDLPTRTELITISPCFRKYIREKS